MSSRELALERARRVLAQEATAGRRAIFAITSDEIIDVCRALVDTYEELQRREEQDG